MNKKTNIHHLHCCILTFLFLIAAIISIEAKDITLYVGMTQYVSCPNSPNGTAINQVKWASKHSSISVTEDGKYGAKIKATSYFSGIAQVQCDYYWYWYQNGKMHTNHATTYYNVTCKAVDIRLNRTGTISLASGEGIQLSVTLSPSITPSPSVYWTSSNSNIASVNSNGYVWAKSPGTAVISASSNAGPDKATVTINVEAVQAESATIFPSIINIVAGESKSLSLSVYPQYASVYSKSWHSENSSVATVNSSGIVTGQSEGSTHVYCLVNGYIESNRAEVSVSKPRLTLSADLESGLYRKGSLVRLTASKSEATIYYTLDGTRPTYKSPVYSSPIKLEKNVVLKAIASKNGFLDSDVMEKSYKVTSLEVISTYPSKDSSLIRTNVVPTISFGENIKLKSNSKGIVLKKGESVIEGETIINGNEVSYVPTKNLESGTYTLTIPAESVISLSNDENLSFSYKFEIKSNERINLISAGHQTSQMIKSDNTLWTWGRNDCGSIGNGTSSSSNGGVPTKIMDNVIYTDAAGLTVAAITESLDLYMWGYNVYGQIGNGTYKDVHTPQKILSNIKNVALSSGHSLAVNTSGELYAWGDNTWGELGIGGRNDKIHPTYVMNKVSEISASEDHSMAVTTDGKLYCWGNGAKGQLGDGSYTSYRSTPYYIMSDVVKVASTRICSYALKKDGSLWAFGSQEWGNLGLNIDHGSATPVLIMNDVRDIDAQYLTAMAIKKDNSLWMWGDNSYGQVGNGEKNTDVFSPVKILDNVRTACVGEIHTMALTMDGKLFCWGGNMANELGVGLSESNAPQLSPLSPYMIPPVSVNIKNCNVEIGQRIVLIPDIKPINSAYSRIEWTSSNPEIASISNFGVIEGISAGTTEIECTIWYDDETKIKSTCEIIVSGTENPKIANNIKDFYIKGANGSEITANFTLTVTYANENYCYVVDNDNTPSLIYGSTSYKPLDIIPTGWKGTYVDSDYQPQITPTEPMPSANDTGKFNPKTYSPQEISKDMINEVIIVNNVQFLSDTPSNKENFRGLCSTLYNNFHTLTFRNEFLIESVKAGVYNVKCVVATYNLIPLLYPIEYINIESGEDAINNIDMTEDDEPAYYNLHGIRVRETESGVYIRKTRDKTQKVIIK